VNKFRDAYNQAARSSKVDVAEQVIDAIHAIRGRFLTEKASGRWVEVERARVVEKTCQALREKEKAKTPTYDPFRNPNKKIRLSPGISPKRARRRRSNRDDGTDDEDESDENETGSSDGSKSSDDSEKTETDDDEVVSKKRKVLVDFSVINRLRTANEEEMMKKLEDFTDAYSHCAVPPGWQHDVLFADWCSAQRQVYREIQSGYRKSTENEDAIIQRLTDLGFVWDYADWHWRDRCEKLEALQDGCSSVDDGGVENPTHTPQDIVDWLQDQRSQLRERTAAEMSSERADKLRELGIAL